METVQSLRFTLLGRQVQNLQILLVRMRMAAHQQIKDQRDAGQVPVPNPLFEHPRMHKFMREVFETIAYGKTTDADAARRLIDDGNALLKRIK